jgi:hypothetical protein
MNKTKTDSINAGVHVFKTGDYVQLTEAQDKHLPVGTTAMVNERYTDGVDFRRDAYFVTFDNDADIVLVQDLAPANVSRSPLAPAENTEKPYAKVRSETTEPPALKRAIESDHSLLAESVKKKTKTDHAKTFKK